jgi:hypothetical protein
MKSSTVLSDIPCAVGTKREFTVVERIVSGGQTGVDRAALRCGLDLGIAVGGYCPAEYRAEDGMVPEWLRHYLVCTESSDYRERTRLNVSTSDATLIIGRGLLAAGTALTVEHCRTLGRPHIVVQVRDPDAGPIVTGWLERTNPRTLNVAGPRESTHPGIDAEAYALLRSVFDPCDVGER